MFLEDELLQIVNDRFDDPEFTPNHVKQTYLDVMNKCKSKIREAIDTKEKVLIKATIDRTIKSYDRSVEQLSKSELKSKRMMAKYFQLFSLKDELFSNSEFEEMYNKL